jgi:hypothetical protein
VEANELPASRRQAQDALDRLRLDPLKLPRLPWDRVHELTDPIFPQSIWGICAATGGGKTSTAAHLIEYWSHNGQRVYVITLEQPPLEYRIALAALRLGYHPQLCLRNKFESLPVGAEKALRQEIIRQATTLEPWLKFADVTAVGLRDMPHQFEEASLFEADVIVLDHWHMLDLKGYGELESFCRAMRGWLTEYGIPVIAMMQLHRGERDILSRFRPPTTHAIQGGEVVPQLLHVCLGLFRPTTPMSKDEEAQVRRGQRSITDFLVPDSMGVHLMKHRTMGGIVGKDATVYLDYKQGRLSDPQTDARAAEEERLGI